MGRSGCINRARFAGPREPPYRLTRLRYMHIFVKPSTSPTVEFPDRKGAPVKKAVVFSLLAAGAVLAGCASNPPGSTSTRTEVCKATSEQEVAALFDRWNQSLQTGDAHKVVANYAEKSVLLPTVSNTPRLNAAQKEDYFEHFLEDKPFGRIDFRTIEIGCTTAVDAGLYTFTFAKTGAVVKARYTYTYKWDGSQWLITSHHSSAMPEK
jgi:uncharacterized protein (TIGR02246 family)